MPRGEWIAEQLNRQLLKDLKIKMAFGFEELDVFQADENERGDSLNKIVTAININPEVARWTMDVLGYDLTDEQAADLEKIVAEKKKEQEEMREQAENAAAAPTPSPAPAERRPAKVAWADDLARWERKALRVIKDSGSAVCTFESALIPADTREQIDAALANCKSADDVKALFGKIETNEAPAQEPAKADPAVLELARQINTLADVYMKSLLIREPSPEPIVIINNNQEGKSKRLSLAKVFAENAFSEGDQQNETTADNN